MGGYSKFTYANFVTLNNNQFVLGLNTGAAPISVIGVSPTNTVLIDPAGVGVDIASTIVQISSDAPSFKVIGARGRVDNVEIAMVQNEGGLRTYGGYFLVEATTSDLKWVRRVNLVDTECFRVENATGNFKIGLGAQNGGGCLSVHTPTSTFNLNVSRMDSVINTEIGIYTAPSPNILVLSIGVDGAVTNDGLIASYGALRFYAGSTTNAAGAFPPNEAFRIDANRNIVCNMRAANLAQNATEGFLHIPAIDGAPSGTPGTGYVGAQALAWDYINKKIVVYDGTGWKATAALT